MFQDELCKHSDIQHVGYSPHTYFETHHWLKGAVLLGMSPKTFSGARTYSGYGTKANAKAYLIDCVTKNVPNFTIPSSDRALLFEGWEALCEKYARPIFFEKSPQYLANWASLSLILDWTATTKHEVKFISLVRNPLSVQYSAQQLFRTDPYSRQFGWLELHKNLLAFESFFEADSFLRVKYEDLIRSPIAEFSRIQQYIGVDQLAEIGGQVHTKSVEKWKDDLNFDLTLDNTVMQMAQHLGYSESELTNPNGNQNQQQPGWRSRLYSSSGLLKVKLRDRLLKPTLIRIKRLGR